MNPPGRASTRRRHDAPGSAFVGLLLLVFALLGAAFGSGGAALTKAGTGSASPSAQFQRGAFQLRANAVRGAERALAAAERSSSHKRWADPDDAAPGTEPKPVALAGRSAVARAGGDTGLPGERLLAYASRAPPAGA